MLRVDLAVAALPLDPGEEMARALMPEGPSLEDEAVSVAVAGLAAVVVLTAAGAAAAGRLAMRKLRDVAGRPAKRKPPDAAGHHLAVAAKVTLKPADVVAAAGRPYLVAMPPQGVAARRSAPEQREAGEMPARIASSSFSGAQELLSFPIRSATMPSCLSLPSRILRFRSC